MMGVNSLLAVKRDHPLFKAVFFCLEDNMVLISKHAMDRLNERFNYTKEDERNICTIINNRNAFVIEGDHRTFHYKKTKIIAVVRDNTVVTFKYDEKTYLQTLSEKRMTLGEIAKALNVSKETVRANGKELFPYEFRNGVKTFLTEVQVTAIKLKIEKHHNLQSTLELPKTELEKELLIHQAMIFQQEKINGMQAVITEMLPKAEFFDQVTSSKDAIDIGTVSNVLNIADLGRNKLFKILRGRKVLRENNQPYREFIDRGYFRVIEQKYSKPDGSTSINFKTVVYQSGVDYIRKIVRTKEIV